MHMNIISMAKKRECYSSKALYDYSLLTQHFPRMHILIVSGAKERKICLDVQSHDQQLGTGHVCESKDSFCSCLLPSVFDALAACL